MGLDFFRLLGRLGLLLLELIAIACFILYSTRPLKDIAFMNNILAMKANLPSTIKYCMQASLYPSIMLPACVDADADADAIDPVEKKRNKRILHPIISLSKYRSYLSLLSLNSH